MREARVGRSRWVGFRAKWDWAGLPLQPLWAPKCLLDLIHLPSSPSLTLLCPHWCLNRPWDSPTFPPCPFYLDPPNSLHQQGSLLTSFRSVPLPERLFRGPDRRQHHHPSLTCCGLCSAHITSGHCHWCPFTWSAFALVTAPLISLPEARARVWLDAGCTAGAPGTEEVLSTCC